MTYRPAVLYQIGESLFSCNESSINRGNTTDHTTIVILVPLLLPRYHYTVQCTTIISTELTIPHHCYLLVSWYYEQVPFALVSAIYQLYFNCTWLRTGPLHGYNNNNAVPTLQITAPLLFNTKGREYQLVHIQSRDHGNQSRDKLPCTLTHALCDTWHT